MHKKIRILSVVGARPNFMKIAPLVRAFARRADAVQHFLVHTGQHYDHAMSGSFFAELEIPPPDHDLGVGSGSQAEQVGRTMMALEPVLMEIRPDWVLVVGDVNATVAAALTARKIGIRVAHVEAGLRSRDESMPEEINRLVTDRISDRLFTTDAESDENLRAEGIPADRIRCVGNVMIDTLDQQWPAAQKLDMSAALAGCLFAKQNLPDMNSAFALVTLHRPSNVDDPQVLRNLLGFLRDDVAPQFPVLWPLHPRTVRQLELTGEWNRLCADSRFICLAPLPYRPLLRLQAAARAVVTDSGGMQEECCVLGTPCLVMRTTTERPVTLAERGGTCVLAGQSPDLYCTAWRQLLGLPRHSFRPPLWDGHAADRIAVDLVGGGNC